MINFDGRVAIVTGAGSEPGGVGIGEAIARLLARLGAHVVAADLDERRLHHTVANISAEALRVTPMVFDATDEGDCARVVSDAVALKDRLDIVINSVGIIGPAGSSVEVAR